MAKREKKRKSTDLITTNAEAYSERTLFIRGQRSTVVSNYCTVEYEKHTGTYVPFYIQMMITEYSINCLVDLNEVNGKLKRRQHILDAMVRSAHFFDCFH